MKNLLFLLTFLCSINTFSQSLTRGPYLQSQTNTSIKIMWRTSDSTIGIVKYGNTPTSLSNTIIDTVRTKNHTIKISGLIANTKYYYSVGQDATVLAGGDEQHHFFTAINSNDTTGFKFWVTGDFGAGNSDQIRVRRWFENYLQSNTVKNWIWLGDNTYSNGTDAEYTRNVFSKDYGYDSIFRFLPFYPIPGNHDYGSVNALDDPKYHRGPYYDMVDVFKNGEMGGLPSTTEAYYSYDYGNTHFLALNSELWQYLYFWDNGNPYRTWIENDIKNSNKKFKVAYWHQPPYSKGSHDSDDGFELNMRAMREKVIPVLERYGIDLVLSGHSHVYERSYLINKHYNVSFTFKKNTMMIDSTSGNPDSNRTYLKYTYGANKDKGTVYAVVGNSGKSEPENGKMYPAMYTKYDGSNAVGSMILEVKGNVMTGTYYKANGDVADKFRIIKQDSSSVITDVRNNVSVNDFKIYPNPFSNSLTLEFDTKETKPTSITIQNIVGQLIVETIWNGKSNIGKNKIDINNLQDLPKGEYIISIKQNDDIVSEKVIKL